MFVRYECGCIGFCTAKSRYKIRRCVGEGTLEVSCDDSRQNTLCSPLSADEVSEVMAELSLLVNRGHALRAVEMAIKSAGIKQCSG